MNTQGYSGFIENQIRDWPACEAITTISVATALALAFGMDKNNAKKITNVTMKRLADKGELVRVHKGVYGITRKTTFGRLTPSMDDMIAGLLLREENKTIGFIGGPSLLNAIGLCSWIPKERHLVTNNYRRRLPPDTAIRIKKPVVKVDDDNVSYLQIIEAFNAMGQYPVDAEKPEEILRGIIRNRQLNNEKLIWYARNYYEQVTLLKTIDITLGGIRN